jgi:hypothetical protein
MSRTLARGVGQIRGDPQRFYEKVIHRGPRLTQHRGGSRDPKAERATAKHAEYADLPSRKSVTNPKLDPLRRRGNAARIRRGKNQETFLQSIVGFDPEPHRPSLCRPLPSGTGPKWTKWETKWKIKCRNSGFRDRLYYSAAVRREGAGLGVDRRGIRSITGSEA